MPLQRELSHETAAIMSIGWREAGAAARATAEVENGTLGSGSRSTAAFVENGLFINLASALASGRSAGVEMER